MTNDNDGGHYSLSRRKALAGLGTIGAAAGLGGIGTYAQFTDTEEGTFTFTAGGIDGSLQFASSYNNEQVHSIEDGFQDTDKHVEDNGGGIGLSFTDIKPGDYGSLLFKIEVQNNPAWVASCLGIAGDHDWNKYEPEVAADDDVSEADPDGEDADGDGELGENLKLLPFYDNDTSSNFFDGGNPQGYQGSGCSTAFWDNASGDLTPKTVADTVNTELAQGTVHWVNGGGTQIDDPPAGTDIGEGCVLLDGDLAGGNSAGNVQGMSVLQPGTPLSFGYDWHLPYDTGNEAQGDKLELNFGFNFSQDRHSGGPVMQNIYEPEG